MQNVETFFACAREREAIRLRRAAGEPAPWTKDPVFKEWRFCNVHRENDKTTAWFREHVRQHLTGQAAVEACLIFRWFNKIETGEIIKDLLLNGWNTAEARRRLTGVSPIVTGAYIIKTPNGKSKLEGLLWCIEQARVYLPKCVPTWGQTLRGAWADLCTMPFQGGFMAYEVVSDLRWTPVLWHAEDILTWANPGPGAARGLGWVLQGDPKLFISSDRKHAAQSARKHADEMLATMRQLLAMSLDENQDWWPRRYIPWEMREVEHWLCETDKYMRTAAGLSTPKQRYRAPAGGAAGLF